MVDPCQTPCDWRHRRSRLPKSAASTTQRGRRRNSSSGCTRLPSRAEQRQKRAKRDRAVAAQAKKRQQAEPKKKSGKGKAVLLHLMSVLAPFLAVAGLGISGQFSLSIEAGEPFWLDGVMGDTAAPFYREPFGLLIMVVVFSLAAAVFWLTMIVGWRRINRWSRDRMPSTGRYRGSLSVASRSVALCTAFPFPSICY